MATDLDDTTNCPLGVRCEACGTELGELAIATADCPLGVMCLTMCARCAASTVQPPVAVSTAAKLVMQHAMHLGITADDMVTLRAVERTHQELGL